MKDFERNACILLGIILIEALIALFSPIEILKPIFWLLMIFTYAMGIRFL